MKYDNKQALIMLMECLKLLINPPELGGAGSFQISKMKSGTTKTFFLKMREALVVWNRVKNESQQDKPSSEKTDFAELEYYSVGLLELAMTFLAAASMMDNEHLEMYIDRINETTKKLATELGIEI